MEGLVQLRSCTTSNVLIEECILYIGCLIWYLIYSQKWTVWPWEAIFYQKMLHKQLFREALNPDSLTSEQSGTPNFKNLTSFNMFPENLGAKAFRWAIGKPAGIKIVRSAAAWNISWGGPQEMQKTEFFASFASPRKFCEEKFYQDRTMWKSADKMYSLQMSTRRRIFAQGDDLHFKLIILPQNVIIHQIQ